VSAANDLLSNYQHVIDSLTFITGAKGVFDVEVDGELLYSKRHAGRHARSNEVLQLFEERYASGVDRFGT
jgi:selenoprotein W-related protein